MAEEAESTCGHARGRSYEQNRVHFDASAVSETSSLEEDNASRSTSAMTSPLSMDIAASKTDTKHIPQLTLLHNNSSGLPEDTSRGGMLHSGNEDSGGEESSTARPFERTASPTSTKLRNRGAAYEHVGEQGICRMHKYSLYETATRYYLVGADIMDQRFRILKIDRTADAGILNVEEDEIVYDKKETSQLLNAIDDGNKGTGGLKLKCSSWGLLGFIRFTGPYYMLLITKRSQVAMIGGHYVYHVDGTELVPLTTGSHSMFKADARHAEESRFLGILNNLDLSRSFYFSYSYDITRTLQHNIMKERDALARGDPYEGVSDYNAMFVWNNHLLRPAMDSLKNTYDWCLPVIHGFIDQAGMSTR